MDTSQIKSALQDLIVRLQDAETGFNEISKATSNIPLKNWLSRYASERHNYHRALESHVALLGGDAHVKTSFLGELHKIFIDIKINNTSKENEFDAIVAEIERGSSTLIEDYDKILSNVELPATISTTLMSQKANIERELTELVQLKEEINAVEA